MALSHLLLLFSLCCVVLPVTSIAEGTGRLRSVAKPAPIRSPAVVAPPSRRIAPWYYPFPVYSPTCCPAGWTRNWNRCFMYIHVPKSWSDAEKKCIKLGGNLASISGTTDNRFVKRMVNRVTCSNRPVWIGGFDSAKEGTWLWSDGSRFYNTKWVRKIKENTREQCLQLNLIGSYWKDQKCDKKFAYVCSMTM